MLRTDLPEIITETLPGPKAAEVIKRREKAVPSAIRCAYPVVIDKGEGAMIQDVDGNKFLDWIGGVGVLNIGFSQPEVVEAVKTQADKYFHGRTHYTMAMTSKKAYAKGMGELANGVFRAQFPYYYRNPEGMPQEAALDYYMNSLTDVFEQCAAADTIAAVVVEPLQGEGGFIPAPIEWVKAVRKLCDDHGILLIADEVQSGFCRTGRIFASVYWQEAGVQPDIIATAKSIAAGVPLSAIIARSEIMEAVAPGTIGGTYCGNPLACAAALKTIEIMERDDLAGRSCEIGEKVVARYNELKEKYECVGDVRGLGGMVGIEFVKDKKTKEPAPELTSAVITECWKRGLLVEGAGTYNNVIRFLAPLVITDEQLAAGLDIFEAAVEAASK